MLTEVMGKEQFETEVMRATVPVVVDFWAPWCGPCRALAPAVESLADIPGARVVKVDVEQNEDLAAEFRVTGLPTLIFFKNGQEVLRYSGVRPAHVLRRDLEALTAS